MRNITKNDTVSPQQSMTAAKSEKSNEEEKERGRQKHNGNSLPNKQSWESLCRPGCGKAREERGGNKEKQKEMDRKAQGAAHKLDNNENSLPKCQTASR